MTGATVIIVARDAGRTIARAVRSAVAEAPARILVVDDHSSDDTAAIARAEGGDRIDVIQTVEHRTLGFARQTGLMAVRTGHAVWLDADDELLPGRVARLLAALTDTGASIAADGAEFVDEATGSIVSAPIPAVLRHGEAAVRLFERNYLPGPGVIAVRTDAAAAIGYDSALHGAEDIDFLLRAIAAGQRSTFVDAIGYRCHASPTSHSRDLTRQRAMYTRALRKHDYSSVRRLYIEAGEERAAWWALASMAIYRDEYGAAYGFLTEARRAAAAGEDTWRFDFQGGTLQLLMGRPQVAHRLLAAAERLQPTPEGANNLGVATAQMGDRRGADALFQAALERLPGYRDALVNLTSVPAAHITSHPLRSEPNRQDYSA
ncbi:MAG TPA: glycosyltransferase [Vicinamibacterales bacterium]|nr:glycosyltransferase [Vicinamibacterales bacterium]